MPALAGSVHLSDLSRGQLEGSCNVAVGRFPLFWCGTGCPGENKSMKWPLVSHCQPSGRHTHVDLLITLFMDTLKEADDNPHRPDSLQSRYLTLMASPDKWILIKQISLNVVTSSRNQRN